MKNAISLLGLILSFFITTQAQVDVPVEEGAFHEQLLDIQHVHSCGLEGIKGEAISLDLRPMFSFESDEEAQTVLNDILNTVGLRPNFVIQASNVPNAAAVIDGSERYILYNRKFIRSVKENTKTNWAAISILAHEIGHHLNGHTLSGRGSWHKMELEADEFSGFVLRRMGATLEEAQAAMKLLGSPTGSSTHPARNMRLKSIADGWKRADELEGTSNIQIPERAPETTPEPEPGPVVDAETESYPDEVEELPEDKPKKKKRKKEKEEWPNEPPVVVESEPAEEIPELEPEPTPPAPVSHPSFALWQVNLKHNPDRTYYITKGNKFVVMIKNSIFTIGQFTKSNNSKYPFVIKFDKSADLMVTESGDLINSKGANVGYLNRV